MKRFIVITCIFSFLSLLLVLGGLISQPLLAKFQSCPYLASAPLEQTPPEEEIKLDARYPVLRGTAGSTYEFEVELRYIGKKPLYFHLSAKGPPGFYISIRPGWEAKEIASIRLDPGKAYPDTIKVVVTPIFLLFAEKLPEPGEYVVTLSVSSEDGKIKGNIPLKVIITDKYGLKAKTGGALEGRLNITATAGEDTPVPIIITNTGTALLKKITFSTEKPAGWSITFSPETIDTLPARASREVEMKVKPPLKAIAGDYMIALKVDEESMLAFDRLDIRVTVLTPIGLAWVGIGIVVVIIAGLAIMFLRLGRR